MQRIRETVAQFYNSFLDPPRHRIFSSLQAALLLSVFLGCSRGLERVSMPLFDSDDVASRALRELDTDGDAGLSERELESSPGLLASMHVFDQDHDGKLSVVEISNQLDVWRGEQAGLLSLRCEVRWKGRPLKDATIRLVAEPFFDGAIPDASGVSDYAGSAELSCDPEHLPEALKSIRAVKPGVYRVEVTHPKVDLPAKYNSKTTLGRSVSLRNSNTLFLNL